MDELETGFYQKYNYFKYAAFTEEHQHQKTIFFSMSTDVWTAYGSKHLYPKAIPQAKDCKKE